MNRQFLPLGAVLAMAFLMNTTPPTSADDDASASSAAQSATTTPGIQFEYEWASAAGARLTTTNGHDEQREGELNGMYAAYGNVPEPDSQPRPLTLRVTEDNTVNGPDGQPGVLRLQYANVPIESKYSGFLFYGIEDTGKIQLPGWTLGEVTMADLRRTFIEFRFRADNPEDANDFGCMLQFRLEPEHVDSYARRAEFGVLIATPRWRTFRRPISSATNLEAFLKSVNNDDPPHFKLVWGQNGPIQSYTPGDSLLIDDVKIVIE